MWHRSIIYAWNPPVIQIIAPIGPLAFLRYTLRIFRHGVLIEDDYESGTKQSADIIKPGKN